LTTFITLEKVRGYNSFTTSAYYFIFILLLLFTPGVLFLLNAGGAVNWPNYESSFAGFFTSYLLFLAAAEGGF
jgi:hypothetical protein